MTNRSLQDSSSQEINKLDAIDRKVLTWLSDHKKSSVAGWIQYVTQEYRSRGVEIDSGKLWNEVKQLG